MSSDRICVCVCIFSSRILFPSKQNILIIMISDSHSTRYTHIGCAHWICISLYFCRCLLSMLIIWNAVFGAPNSAPIFIEYKFILFKLIYDDHMLFLFGFLKWSIHSIRLNALSSNLGDIYITTSESKFNRFKLVGIMMLC